MDTHPGAVAAPTTRPDGASTLPDGTPVRAGGTRPGAAASAAGPARSSRPQSVRMVLEQLRERDLHDSEEWAGPVATGFDLLDHVLDGGLRATDFMLLCGGPGVGKTVAGLQIARHAAQCGRPTVFVSYEYDGATMLGRLLALELGSMARRDNAMLLDRARSLVLEAAAGYRSLEELVRTDRVVAAAHARVEAYADQLWFVRGSGAHTDLDALEAAVPEDAEGDPVMVIDYLQKVAVTPEPERQSQRLRLVSVGLKDLALRRRMVVIGLVASDEEGMRTGRVRLHNMPGSSSLAYECDVAVMLNDKYHAVARDHLLNDPARAETFRSYVIFSVEKNRGGPAMVDLEYRKDFVHYRFVPTGGYLLERLTDDRLASDAVR